MFHKYSPQPDQSPSLARNERGRARVGANNVSIRASLRRSRLMQSKPLENPHQLDFYKHYPFGTQPDP
jgi:hypothetical protein